MDASRDAFIFTGTLLAAAFVLPIFRVTPPEADMLAWVAVGVGVAAFGWGMRRGNPHSAAAVALFGIVPTAQLLRHWVQGDFHPVLILLYIPVAAVGLVVCIRASQTFLKLMTPEPT